MSDDPSSIGQQGRVPFSWQGNQAPPGVKPRVPVVLNNPSHHHWLVGGRQARASAYAEALRAVGVDYAPVSTFARVMRP